MFLVPTFVDAAEDRDLVFVDERGQLVSERRCGQASVAKRPEEDDAPRERNRPRPARPSLRRCGGWAEGQILEIVGHGAATMRRGTLPTIRRTANSGCESLSVSA